MTIKELVEELWRLEGKKSKVSIANIRELVSIISDRCFSEKDGLRYILTLLKHGERRALKKKKK